jgi:hypothetical protein
MSTREHPVILPPHNLQSAIANFREIRELLYQRFPVEAEILYQLTSIVTELNQYLEGGYMDIELMVEKTETIQRMAWAIAKEVFEVDNASID